MRVRVWDVPTRLFHWALTICVAGAILYANIGGDWMHWHFRCGYAVIALLLFRIVWGFVGPKYARFSSFPPSPRATIAHLKKSVLQTLGHHPLAAWSIYALLVVLSVQALGGLFSRDDEKHAGALSHLISPQTSDFIADLHSANAWTIYTLVGLHLAAVFWYSAIKHVSIIEPMVLGDKEVEPTDPIAATAASLSADDDGRVLGKAAVIFAICAALVWAVVTRL